MTKIYTTLNKIHSVRPCEDSWVKLLAHLGKTKADDEPLAFSTILESNGLEDALWALRSAPEYSNQWRLMAVRFAREVQHWMKDARSIHALDVAEMHSKGEATNEELAVAREAAWAATWLTAEVTTWDAAWDAALDAAKEAAQDAAWATIRIVAKEFAEDAAWPEIKAAARKCALACTRAKQSEIFLEIVK
jgi:hypothetical protein